MPAPKNTRAMVGPYSGAARSNCVCVSMQDKFSRHKKYARSNRAKTGSRLTSPFHSARGPSSATSFLAVATSPLENELFAGAARGAV